MAEINTRSEVFLKIGLFLAGLAFGMLAMDFVHLHANQAACTALNTFSDEKR